ncbi:hypothetical protein N1851_005669 [Merluccius polli]|uniref:Ig-like domain-containing protein n=1 Tax=Merluccius polli TaxID=89951 RepID=A0AA47P6H1_MERPO|nr:hypothetical protein N1851_005669 [Merluccius polli]
MGHAFECQEKQHRHSDSSPRLHMLYPLREQTHSTTRSDDTHSAWLHNSLSASQTTEVESGVNVTLSCTNVSRDSPTLAFWMRAVHTSSPAVISSVYGTKTKPDRDETQRHCEGTWPVQRGVLGSVMAILGLVIVGLVFKIRQLQIDSNNEPLMQDNQESDQNQIFYTTMSFPQRRHAGPKADPEPGVVYAATR